MVAIFSYEFHVATENFERANVNLMALSNYSHLLEQAVDSKYITDDELTTLEKWRQNPGNWNK